MVRYLFDIGRQDPIEPVMTAQQAREEVESRILARAAANVGDKTTKQLKMEQIEAIISTRGEASAKQLALEIDLTRRTIAQYLQIDRRFCVGRVGPRGEKFYILRRAA